MRTFTIAITATAIALSSPAEAISKKTWDHASTVGEIALTATALGLPAFKGDGEGTLQAGGSLGASFLAAQALKHTFPELRPDGSDRKSFPSGHTSVSFAAAATMQQRYGWKVGLPATLAASFVGLARVEADKHHWYDVVAGAAIGEASGFLITSKANSSVRVLPWGDSKGGGIAMGVRF